MYFVVSGVKQRCIKFSVAAVNSLLLLLLMVLILLGYHCKYRTLLSVLLLLLSLTSDVVVCWPNLNEWLLKLLDRIWKSRKNLWRLFCRLLFHSKTTFNKQEFCTHCTWFYRWTDMGKIKCLKTLLAVCCCICLWYILKSLKNVFP